MATPPTLPADMLAIKEASLARVKKYTCVSTEGVSEEESAMVWVEQVIGRSLCRPMQEALKSGAALCELISAASPGIIPGKILEEARAAESTSADGSAAAARARAKECAAIDAYLKASDGLGVRATFATPDLHDGRGMKLVVRQLFGLAQTAVKLEHFPGPHLCDARTKAGMAEKLEEAAGMEAEA